MVEKALLLGAQDRRESISHVELAVDVLQVTVHGPLRYPEPTADSGRSKAATEQDQHGLLARRQQAPTLSPGAHENRLLTVHEQQDGLDLGGQMQLVIGEAVASPSEDECAMVTAIELVGNGQLLFHPYRLEVLRDHTATRPRAELRTEVIDRHGLGVPARLEPPHQRMSQQQRGQFSGLRRPWHLADGVVEIETDVAVGVHPVPRHLGAERRRELRRDRMPRERHDRVRK